MAFPWAAAVSGGTGIVAPIISNLFQRSANEHAWNKSVDMYNIQKQDAEHQWYLQNEYNENMWHQENAYNEHMWNMANDYNSPANQMARFSQAGLNPNLIYGQSNTTSPVSSASFNSKPFDQAHQGQFDNTIAPLGDLGGSAFVNAYNQSQINAAQVANIQAQTAKTAADTQAVGVQTETSRVNLQNIKDWSWENMRLQNQKLAADTMSVDAANERAVERHVFDLQQLAENVKKSRGENVNIDVRNSLEAYEAQMKQMGIYPGDGIYVRLAGIILQKLGIIQKVDDIINYLK